MAESPGDPGLAETFSEENHDGNYSSSSLRHSQSCSSVKKELYDVMILYSEEDRDAAIKFQEHLINDIKLPNNEPVRAVLYDDVELQGSPGLLFSQLDQAFQMCRLTFIYLTESFVKNIYTTIVSDSCLMRTIDNKAERWRVVPVYTQKMDECSYQIPMGLNALKGIAYYSNDDFYRQGVSHLIRPTVEKGSLFETYEQKRTTEKKENTEVHNMNESEQRQDQYDDPEIQLTDGPVHVRVEHSSETFYMEHREEAYSMTKITRGKALILNVNKVGKNPPRKGTNIDRDKLEKLLRRLQFDVSVYNDRHGLTTEEMGSKLKQFSQLQAHTKAECVVVCILSHGNNVGIYGTDGNILKWDVILDLFDNTRCKVLRGKPKIFIFQACRGAMPDEGANHFTVEPDGPNILPKLPTKSDMLICFATQDDYVSYRDVTKGSWYIGALVQVFMKYAYSIDVCNMMNKVNNLVSKKESGGLKQMSEYRSCLTKTLYFFPGITQDTKDRVRVRHRARHRMCDLL